MIKHVVYVILILLYSCNTNQSPKETVTTDENTKIPDFNVIGEDLPSELNRKLYFAPVQFISIDLNEDGVTDTVLIEEVKKWTNNEGIEYEWNDPGDFHRIKIAVSGQTEKQWVNIDGWVNTSSLLKYNKNIAKESITQSDHVVICKAGLGNILVFMAGYTYASSPGLLTIINIYKGVDANLIFNKSIELYGLKDFNEDGIKDLITTVWDGYFKTVEENQKRHKVYLLNGNFTFSPEHTQEFCDQF